LRVVTLLVVGIAALATAGCSTRVAVVSREKSAYVVRSEGPSSNMYHCKVDGGKPICTRVEELE